jgi:hypothetical protein
MNLEPLRELISRLHNLKCDVLTKETGASLCNTPQIASNNYIHFIFFYIISSSSWVFPDFSPFFSITHESLQASVGLVEGVDVGLGLCVCAFLAAGSVLGEYTGVLSRRRTEVDGVYGYGWPVVEPDLVINAKEGLEIWEVEIC